MGNSKKDDFDPVVEFKAKLDRIDRPDKFAEFFCAAAKSQVPIKEAVSDIIKEIICDDKGVKERIKDLLHEIQRDNIRFMLSGFAWLITTAISFVVGALVTIFFNNLLK